MRILLKLFMCILLNETYELLNYSCTTDLNMNGLNKLRRRWFKTDSNIGLLMEESDVLPCSLAKECLLSLAYFPMFVCLDIYSHVLFTCKYFPCIC